MYKKKSTVGRDQMRRQYNPPPTYGGSRFIRATHGVRGLEDNELASQAQGNKGGSQERWEQRRVSPRDKRGVTPNAGELLPDFEYYGNLLSDGSDTHVRDSYDERTFESDQSREQWRMAEDEYRDSPAPVDRFGHDYNMSPFSSMYGAVDADVHGLSDETVTDDRNDGVPCGTYGSRYDDRGGQDVRARGDCHGGCEWDGLDEEHDGESESFGCSEHPAAQNSEHGGSVPGGRHSRRPVKRHQRLRTDRPLAKRCGGQEVAPADECCDSCTPLESEQKPHPLLNFSVEEGDLLLLVILALLAGEDGCADLVAAIALLLMIRQN